MKASLLIFLLSTSASTVTFAEEPPSLWDRTKTAGISAWGDTKDISGDAAHQAKHGSKKVWVSTKEGSQDLWHHFKGDSKEAWRVSKDGSKETWYQTKDR